MLTRLWNDPLLFNYFIMVIYTCTCFWSAFHNSWVDVWYWASALSITAVVTFGYTR